MTDDNPGGPNPIELRPSDLDIKLEDELVDHPIVTVKVRTPFGTLRVMAELTTTGRAVAATNVHVHGVDIGSRSIGPARIRRIVMAIMEALDVDQAEVVGAIRTTGAGPGRRPGRLRFTRHSAP